MSILNAAMSKVVRCSQMRAEIMMQRKDSSNYMASDVHQDWYFTTTSKLIDMQTPSSARTDSRKPTPITRRRLERGTLSSIRKHLPYYLTSNGSLVSASLEEFDGEMVYCTPSLKSNQQFQEEGEDGIMGSSSVFLTDVTCCDSSRSQSGTVREELELINTPSTCIASKSSKYGPQVHWEPLTTAALLEQTSVTEVPIQGMGHLVHGQYHMWRPHSGTTDA